MARADQKFAVAICCCSNRVSKGRLGTAAGGVSIIGGVSSGLVVDSEVPGGEDDVGLISRRKGRKAGVDKVIRQTID